MTIAFVIEVAIFIAALASSVIYASSFEWLLHKYFMHRMPQFWKWKFSYAFKAHAVVHHHVFKADDTYHLQEEKNKHLIPMAWWNGAVLIAIGLIPFALLCWFIGHWWSILLGIGIGCTAYYIAYESMHWCMHNPLLKRRLVERYTFFRKLNGHHILHHRYMNKNYNVVLPLWDLILGTLMRRAPKAFRQVRGRSVPSVQPLS